MLCTPKPNGFHDHYPVFKWLFHWEYTLFSDKPMWFSKRLSVMIFLPATCDFPEHIFDHSLLEPQKHIPEVLCSFECRNWRAASPLQVRLEQEEGVVVGNLSADLLVGG